MKKVIRNKVFETNSSTNHSLILYSNKTDEISKIDSIGLLSKMDFFTTHIGLKEKFSFFLTECMFIEYEDKRKYYNFLLELLDTVNKEYNTNIKFDLSKISDVDFYFDWLDYSDGCNEHFILTSEIDSNKKNKETIENRVNGLIEDLRKEYEFEICEYGVEIDLFNIQDLLLSPDGYLEILTNPNLAISTTH